MLNNRIQDSELIIASSATVVTGTTSTPVRIESIGCGDEDLGLMCNVTLASGTFDASNNYTVELKASTAVSGTYYTVAKDTILKAGSHLIPFNTRQVADAVGSENATHYEMTTTQVGSTATALTLSSYIVRGV